MKRLGPYELLRKIGSGGMAEVWMGRRPAMGGASKAVAIKLLARHLADDPEYRQMFIDEARLSMLLSNSNVVQVFDVGEDEGECFMVMEWVDGLNLADLTRNMAAKGENLAVEMAAHVIGEVLRGLAYAHALQHDGGSATIVHRDVSPQNVLCSVSGEVKLADFGVARLAREETSGLHVKGKLRYMAPEQLRGRSREPTVDLYAVGAMLHELLGGEKFRKTRDEADLYAIVLSGEYPPLSASLPAELITVCKRLLEPDATLRVQTAEAALELLARWPGYRNGAIELGRLVREYSGISGPRSGIVHFPPTPTPAKVAPELARTDVLASADTLAADKPVERTTLNPSGSASQSGTPTELVAPRESGPVADQGVTAEMRSWPSSGAAESTRPELPVKPSAESRSEPRSSTSLWLLLAAGLAIVFGVFGLGVGLEWWGPRAGQREAVTKTTSAGADDGSDPGSDAAQPDAAQPMAKDATSTTGDDEGTTSRTTETGAGETTDTGEGDTSTTNDVEPEAGSETGTTTGTTTGPTIKSDPPQDRNVDRTPAEVQFLVGDFTFVFIKVAGKELALEPSAKIELKPGRHRVQLRKGTSDEWQAAGTIKIDPGKRYKVRMTKPAGVKLEQLP